MSPRVPLRPIAAVALVLLAACGRTETYGFVAVLGNDTTSVERIRRTGHRIVGDAIGRSPTVTRRHWEAELAPNGVIKSWSMDTYIPNAPPADQRIHHTAVFSDRATSFTRRTSTGSHAWAYQREYPETVPWNAFVYATWELLLDAARRQPDTTRARIGQYFFEGWDEGHVGYADIVRNPDGSYAISSTGLAGSGLAHVDTNGRLTSYSGQGTTYKQEVRRTTDVPDIDAITTRFAAEEQRTGLARSLSPRDTVRATVGGASLTIDYGRPARRGRTLVGALLPYDEVWRTGANAATQLTVSAPIDLAGVALRAGTYTLWTLPSRTGVSLIINGQSGQWGTEYDAGRDIARRAMTVDSSSANVEQFTIRIVPPSGQAGVSRLALEWGSFRWSVPIRAARPSV
ncbi:MAG TPA: DUF2911 domain-containing protein [Gemmatimonadales bacterium]|nr:DUF2911 domain-containing protein [Gemmatimonadales bacterium]